VAAGNRANMKERLEGTVHGMVQGVGFRWFVVREADRLGLTGWTANEPDGSVTVVAEGTPGALEALADSLRDGPPGAAVERFDERRSPATGEFSGFRIRPGGHRGD
jgi:acylphosphatase